MAKRFLVTDCFSDDSILTEAYLIWHIIQNRAETKAILSKTCFLLPREVRDNASHKIQYINYIIYIPATHAQEVHRVHRLTRLEEAIVIL